MLGITLFTTEEHVWILAAAQKFVPGQNGQPTAIQSDIDEVFPLTCPEWDHSDHAGIKRLKVYWQIIMGESL